MGTHVHHPLDFGISDLSVRPYAGLHLFFFHGLQHIEICTVARTGELPIHVLDRSPVLAGREGYGVLRPAPGAADRGWGALLRDYPKSVNPGARLLPHLVFHSFHHAWSGRNPGLDLGAQSPFRPTELLAG